MAALRRATPRKFSPTNRADFSVEAWIQPHADDSVFRELLYTAEHYSMTQPAEAGGFRLGWDDDLSPVAWSDETEGTSDLVAPRVMTLDTWHHVVFTYSAATTTMTIYLDGEPALTATFLFQVPSGSPVAGFGSLQGRGNVSDLDELAIYGVALPASRVAAHVAAR